MELLARALQCAAPGTAASVWSASDLAAACKSLLAQPGQETQGRCFCTAASAGEDPASPSAKRLRIRRTCMLLRDVLQFRGLSQVQLGEAAYHRVACKAGACVAKAVLCLRLGQPGSAKHAWASSETVALVMLGLVLCVASNAWLEYAVVFYSRHDIIQYSTA